MAKPNIVYPGQSFTLETSTFKENAMAWDNCVRYNGKTYFWNPDKKEVVEIIANNLNIVESPPEVMQGLIKLLSEKSPEAMIPPAFIKALLGD